MNVRFGFGESGENLERGCFYCPTQRACLQHVGNGTKAAFVLLRIDAYIELDCANATVNPLRLMQRVTSERELGAFGFQQVKR